MKLMTNFLTNRTNLYSLLCLSYLIIGYFGSAIGLTITQLLFVCMVIGMGNIASHLIGYEKGIQYALTTRPNFVKELDKLKKTLYGISIIDNYSLDEFSINNSVIKIYYYGNPKRLRTELAKFGYRLKNDQGFWELYKDE